LPRACYRLKDAGEDLHPLPEEQIDDSHRHTGPDHELKDQPGHNRADAKGHRIRGELRDEKQRDCNVEERLLQRIEVKGRRGCERDLGDM
jgi:hypothetical protein